MSRYCLQVVLQPVSHWELPVVLFEEIFTDKYEASTRAKFLITQMTVKAQQRVVFYVIPISEEYEI